MKLRGEERGRAGEKVFELTTRIGSRDWEPKM